jgi:hypothetical protein
LGVGGSGHELVAHAWLELHDRPLEDVAAFSLFHQVPIDKVV